MTPIKQITGIIEAKSGIRIAHLEPSLKRPFTRFILSVDDVIKLGEFFKKNKTLGEVSITKLTAAPWITTITTEFAGKEYIIAFEDREASEFLSKGAHNKRKVIDFFLKKLKDEFNINILEEDRSFYKVDARSYQKIKNLKKGDAFSIFEIKSVKVEDYIGIDGDYEGIDVWFDGDFSIDAIVTFRM